MEEIEPDGGKKCTFSFLGMRHQFKNSLDIDRLNGLE
jgi:hypothetical protein